MSLRRPRARTNVTVSRRHDVAWVLLAACAAIATVPTSAESSLRQQVEAAAIPIAEAQVVSPDRFEVISSRFGGADAGHTGVVVLEPTTVDGPNESGNVQVKFRVLLDGVPQGEARAVVRGRVLGPALQASRTLVRGKAIAVADLELRDSDLTRLRQPPLRNVERVHGLVPLRTLGASRVLTPDLLTVAPVVRRGQTVEMRYRRARLSVRALATVLRDGVPGEVVPAENQASGTVVYGTVQLDGTLAVESLGRGNPS